MSKLTPHKIPLKYELYRKLIHLSSLWMVIAVHALTQIQSVILFTLMLIGITGFEYTRHSIPFIQNIISKYIGSILRNHESHSMTGAFYVVFAVLVSVLLFPKEIAVVSITIMLLSDTFAALVGRAYGRIKVLDKSLEGCAAFFLSAMTILLYAVYTQYIIIGVLASLIIGFIVTFVELISNTIKIDDNLSIVLSSGLIIWIFTILVYI